MSVRIRAFGLEVLGILLSLYFVLKDMYQTRKLLLKGVKLAVRVAQWGIIKFVGMSIVFLSSVVLCVLPIASWFFVQAGLRTPSVVILPYTIGTSIAVLIYGFVGLVGLGTGLWIVAPKHYVGRFGRNLVVVHIFRRKKGKTRTGHNFLTSARFGLIHRLVPKFW